MKIIARFIDYNVAEVTPRLTEPFQVLPKEVEKFEWFLSEYFSSPRRLIPLQLCFLSVMHLNVETHSAYLQIWEFARILKEARGMWGQRTRASVFI